VAPGTAWWWLAFLFCIAGSPTERPQAPIRIHLAKRICTAPCEMNATVVIPKHPDNRSAAVVWSYDGNTDWPLGPETEQVTFTVAIGKLEKGDHTVYAVLLREKSGKQDTFEDSQRISVR
jgi:hypothetical protein